ncbi:hypothetical protein HMPREF1544_09864 [Mucor circinelloides 1006PhL]|uniref:FAR1 domain-containing protein n=1 Tax=Mucor circinelloides f. circinelloides (strain 1006PhL) TaxID=1220926 RepID=S2J1D5_MUCC1|nr:hypothetical protein HMPREF1544_09864 [Mucor circinelloides 1006PhL]KAG1116296.1 hypothetical protein G6F42_013733 [Rhizopus arrhizus]
MSDVTIHESNLCFVAPILHQQQLQHQQHLQQQQQQQQQQLQQQAQQMQQVQSMPQHLQLHQQEQQQHQHQPTPAHQQDKLYFETLEEAEAHFRQVNKERGHFLVKRSSQLKQEKGKMFLLLECKFGGVFRPTKKKSVSNPRDARSAKVNCKYAVRITEKDAQWVVKPSKFEHTCEPKRGIDIYSLPENRQFDEVQTNIFNVMYETNASNRAIANALSSTGKLVFPRDIKNKRARIKQATSNSNVM